MHIINAMPIYIMLGNQRDFGHTIQFDLTAWADLNADDLKITYMRPGESATYPVPDGDVSVADNVLTWTISEAVTAINGTGSVVIEAYRGGEMLKHSARIATIIGEGHEPAGEAPDPVADWIREADAKLDEVDESLVSANAAEGLREAAETARETAEGLRAGAETSRNTAEGLRASAETSRKEAEVLRVAAEAARMGFKPMGPYIPTNENKYGEWYTHEGGSYGYIYPTPSTGVSLTDTSHWQQIASRGMTGPSAYDAAVAGGYAGTEAEFNVANAGIEAAKDSALGAAETANEAAENAETAAYRSMLWRKTASGNPVSVFPVPESPLYPKVSGTFMQEGTGDPSPSNIRPITPWLASGGTVNIVQTGGATITLTAPQEISAGWMDNEGRGQVTWRKKVFNGTEAFTLAQKGTNTFRAYYKVPGMSYGATGVGLEYVACDRLKTLSSFGVDQEGVVLTGVDPNGLINFRVSYTRIGVSASDADATIIGALKTWLSANNLAVWYRLFNPLSIAPATAPLAALPQIDRVTPRQNVLTASTGNIELTYAKSPIREADELAAAIALL